MSIVNFSYCNSKSKILEFGLLIDLQKEFFISFFL